METIKLQRQIKSLIESIYCQFELVEDKPAITPIELEPFLAQVATLQKKSAILEHLSQANSLSKPSEVIAEQEILKKTFPEIIETVEETPTISAPVFKPETENNLTEKQHEKPPITEPEPQEVLPEKAPKEQGVLVEPKTIGSEIVSTLIKTDPIAEIVPETEVELKKEVTEPVIPPAVSLPDMAVSINDKFIFINHLFNKNNQSYSKAIEQINATHTAQALQKKLDDLMTEYNWDEDNEHFITFTKLAHRRIA